MASAMSLMKSGPMGMEVAESMDLGGVAGVAVDGAVGFGASYALGQVYHRYNSKWYGKQAPRLAAAGGKVGAIIVQLATGGRGGLLAGVLTGISNGVGNAGINAMGLEMGLRHARAATGKRAVLMDKGAALPAGATEMATGIGNTEIGALGGAPAGRGLSWDQIEELAAGR